MADGLTVNGLALRVRQNTWRELPSLYQGGRQRMRGGNLISTEDAATRKRVAECEVYFITDAEETTARDICLIGEAVTVAGELPVTTFLGAVDFGQTTAMRWMEGGAQVLHRVASVHIEQT